MLPPDYYCIKYLIDKFYGVNNYTRTLQSLILEHIDVQPCYQAFHRNFRYYIFTIDCNFLFSDHQDIAVSKSVAGYRQAFQLLQCKVGRHRNRKGLIGIVIISDRINYFCLWRHIDRA